MSASLNRHVARETDSSLGKVNHEDDIKFFALTHTSRGPTVHTLVEVLLYTH